MGKKARDKERAKAEAKAKAIAEGAAKAAAAKAKAERSASKKKKKKRIVVDKRVTFNVEKHLIYNTLTTKLRQLMMRDELLVVSGIISSTEEEVGEETAAEVMKCLEEFTRPLPVLLADEDDAVHVVDATLKYDGSWITYTLNRHDGYLMSFENPVNLFYFNDENSYLFDDIENAINLGFSGSYGTLAPGKKLHYQEFSFDSIRESVKHLYKVPIRSDKIQKFFADCIRDMTAMTVPLWMDDYIHNWTQMSADIFAYESDPTYKFRPVGSLKLSGATIIDEMGILKDESKQGADLLRGMKKRDVSLSDHEQKAQHQTRKGSTSRGATPGGQRHQLQRGTNSTTR
ncbi:hypothetical protein Tsubulata_048255 [Turnera subulata]|uniref:rRNA N-glycosylase n=1 Tax=Turnera subulata TaxID=218843 RepID=A0A9Q0JLZ3_9ROSI|nr:hypothetical protein Tsubulata_048255 [Turnera subulata]